MTKDTDALELGCCFDEEPPEYFEEPALAAVVVVSINTSKEATDGHVPPTHRAAEECDDEDRLLLHPPAVRQGSHSAHVFAARMPLAFGSFYGKVSRLDKKLELAEQTAVLIRERGREHQHVPVLHGRRALLRDKAIPDNRGALRCAWRVPDEPALQRRRARRPRLRDRADNATRRSSPKRSQRLAGFYSEREICDIVWLVASEHLYNMTNIGLNIGSDGLCELSPVGEK